jgi:hypothetical protein
MLCDGKVRRVMFSIIEDGGFAFFGRGVEWCVTGLDRNWASGSPGLDPGANSPSLDLGRPLTPVYPHFVLEMFCSAARLSTSLVEGVAMFRSVRISRQRGDQ